MAHETTRYTLAKVEVEEWFVGPAYWTANHVLDDPYDTAASETDAHDKAERLARKHRLPMQVIHFVAECVERVEPGSCRHCGSSNPCDCVDRINCDEVGEIGHQHCGRCPEHGRPRFVCGCLARKAVGA